MVYAPSSPPLEPFVRLGLERAEDAVRADATAASRRGGVVRGAKRGRVSVAERAPTSASTCRPRARAACPPRRCARPRSLGAQRARRRRGPGAEPLRRRHDRRRFGGAAAHFAAARDERRQGEGFGTETRVDAPTTSASQSSDARCRSKAASRSFGSGLSVRDRRLGLRHHLAHRDAARRPRHQLLRRDPREGAQVDDAARLRPRNRLISGILYPDREKALRPARRRPARAKRQAAQGTRESVLGRAPIILPRALGQVF